MYYYGSTYVNWELSLNRQTSHVSLNSLRHAIGTTIIYHIGPHPVKYEVISANTTFMRATVTMDPIKLNGTTIVCNRITIMSSSSISSKFIFEVKRQQNKVFPIIHVTYHN